MPAKEIESVASQATSEVASAWLTFIASIVGSLAWPAAVVMVAFMFRSDLKALLPKLASIKAGGMEALFNVVRSMDPLPEKEPAESAKSGIAAPPDAEKEVIYSFDESINSRNDNGSEKPSPYGQSQEQKAPGSHRPIMEFDTFFNALELAETSPAAALLLAWSSVEANVIKCARLNGMDLHGKQLTAYSAFLFLEKSGLTSPEMDRRFKELLNLRNKVAHLSLADLPTEVVEQYILMAEDLVGKLPY